MPMMTPEEYKEWRKEQRKKEKGSQTSENQPIFYNKQARKRAKIARRDKSIYFTKGKLSGNFGDGGNR